MPKITDKIEKMVLANALAEFEIDEQNHSKDNEDFEVHMNLFNLIGDQPEEDWMANIYLPEFYGEIVTQASIEAAQEFQRRDFVAVYHESKKPEHMAAAEADKELINRTLNQPHVHYFQKRMRASGLKNITGKVYYKCWWERKITKFTVTENQTEELDIDVDGEPMVSDEQIAQRITLPVEIEKEHIVYDRWNIDVLDSRNVFCSPEYTYSLQDKRRVTIRFDTDIGEMEDNQDIMGYINLDKARKALKKDSTVDTDTKKGDDFDEPQEYQFTQLKPIMMLETYKKEWVKVNANGMDITPGFDSRGEREKGAVLMEIIKCIAHVGETKVLVRYQRNKNRDPFGNAYRPITKGICYIHPTSDLGVGDGKASRGPQTAMNDVFNMGVDKLRIALNPVVKAGTASASEFRDTWEFAPRAVWEAYNPDDLKEMVMDDNISGAMALTQFFKSEQNQVTATSPQSQGVLPLASTTATATADAAARTDARSHYKGLTNSHTALNEIYRFIKWQTFQYARPETAQKLMGEKVFEFDPYADHAFKIVTEAIETNESKINKINLYNQQFQQVAAIGNPGTLGILNKILAKQARLLGDEYEESLEGLFNEKAEFQPTSGGGTPAVAGQPTTNQTGLIQSPQEQSVRGQLV